MREAVGSTKCCPGKSFAFEAKPSPAQLSSARCQSGFVCPRWKWEGVVEGKVQVGWRRREPRAHQSVSQSVSRALKGLLRAIRVSWSSQGQRFREQVPESALLFNGESHSSSLRDQIPTIALRGGRSRRKSSKIPVVRILTPLEPTTGGDALGGPGLTATGRVWDSKRPGLVDWAPSMCQVCVAHTPYILIRT